MKCKYCGAVEYKKSNNRLSTDEMKEVINSLEGLADEVELFGGEPFLISDAVGILEYISIKGLSISITTNGQEDLEILNTICDKNVKLKNLSVSLDGIADVNDIVRGVGTYAKAQRFLERALELKRQGKITANVGISAVLTTVNAKTIGTQLSKWIEQSVDFVIISPVAEIGRAKEAKELVPNAKQLLDIYEDIGVNIAGRKWENKIYLDMKYPMLGEYLDAKFGTKFPIEKQTCEAVSDILYVSSDGKLKPCREFSDVIADLKHENVYDKIQGLELFIKHQKNHVIKKNCDCIYAENCNICCLSVDDSKSELCMEVERRYNISNLQNRLEFELTEKCCRIQDEKTDYYAIQYFYPNERVEYEKIGFDILSSVSKRKKNAHEIAKETGVDATLIFRFLIQSYSKGHVYRTEVC